MSDAATVTDLPAPGMLILRADLADPAVAAALAAQGFQAPGVRRVAGGPEAQVLWFAPDEALLIVPRDTAPALREALAAGLGATRHLLVDMSDARALFAIEGPGAREVLARGAPVDLAPQAFGPGDLRRTRLGQVAVAFWCAGPDSFRLVCFRSVADHVRTWLGTAAAAGPAGLYAGG
jgi:sarcosine oxidase, subunit gamma